MPILVPFPILLQTELLRVYIPTIILQMDVHTRFSPTVPQGLFCYPIYWASASGNLNLLGASSNFARVYADTASLASPAHPGTRDISSHTLAAVMCDAEEPCSVSTAQDPELSFTASPRSTTRPLYLWFFFRCPVAIFKMTEVHKRCNMDLCCLTFVIPELFLCCFLLWILAKLVHVFWEPNCPDHYPLPPLLPECSLLLEQASADEPTCKDSQNCILGLQYALRDFVRRLRGCGIVEIRKHQSREDGL